MKITGYNAICNLGNNIDEIYNRTIVGDTSRFEISKDLVKNYCVRIGLIKTDLPVISNLEYDLRCNRLILKVLELVKNKIESILQKYPQNKIGIIVATTNSGIEEFEISKRKTHYELGTPAFFLKTKLGTEGFYTTISTACSSGIKAFFTANDVLNSGVSDAVIVVCVDSLAKISLYGFNSLEVLSAKPSIPFDKNREGMNIAESCSIFILEKEGNGIDIMGLGESSDIYHITTPDPDGVEAANAINMALAQAGINPDKIDYINAHGTGTIANDIMESGVIYKIFGNKTPTSSTKSMTGHCLGAAAGIETALCCRLIDGFDGRLYPNTHNQFDNSLPKIKLVSKGERYPKCNICMCNSFGFGGSNAIMILGRNNE